MASPEQPAAKCVDAPPILRLSDDHLGELFLRLPTLEDIGRAATACPTFRRVIAGRAFLRRLRPVHPPRFLGFVGAKFYPAEAPHPSARYARALAPAADFSFAFVPFPSPGPWFLRDVRDGRVLFDKPLAAGEIAVADPVSRRYALLLALQPSRLHLETFLVPATDDEEPTSFRVICMAVTKARLIAFVFSSADGEWRGFPFRGWRSFAGKSGAELSFTLSWRYCVDGCMYWRVAWTKQLLVLDMRRMEFSFQKIPPRSLPEYSSDIAEAENGRPEMFALRKHGHSRFESLFSSRRSDTGGANAWQSSNKVRIKLPSHDCLVMAGAAGRYLLLQGSATSSHEDAAPSSEQYFGYFSLEVQTMRLEKVCESKDWFLNVNLYIGFPPSLSHPSL